MNLSMLFERKATRRLIAAFMICSTILILFLSVTSYIYGKQLEESLMRRESEIAGNLIESHPEIQSYEIAAAFSAPATESTYLKGSQALSNSGFSPDIADSIYSFLPSFEHGSTVVNSVCGVFAMLLFGSAVLLAIKSIYRRINMASDSINSLARGNYKARCPISEFEEGTFARFALGINEVGNSVSSGFEKLAREREFLKDLLSDISHQLKTPLAALRMYNEIIMQEQISAPARDFAEKSTSQIDRMEWLSLGLLKTARIEAGMMELDMHTNDAAVIVERCVDSFRDSAASKGVNITSSGSSVQLVCDAQWLEEAIKNILKNDMEYVTDGGRISIETIETPVAVMIRIQDNGTGIHPDDLPFIFKRFYRGKYSRGDGSGIGLSLARSLATQMGGTLTAESSFGSGAVFTFTFIKGIV